MNVRESEDLKTGLALESREEGNDAGRRFSPLIPLIERFCQKKGEPAERRLKNPDNGGSCYLGAQIHAGRKNYANPSRSSKRGRMTGVREETLF